MEKHLLKLQDKTMKKGALEISFGWLFAIIAGIIILFLAIYLSSKLMSTEKETVSAETGKEIGILLNPLETSFESAQTTSITIPAETRIHNKCELTGTFGKQLIQLDQKSFNKWTKTEVYVSFNNKYIFSNEEIEGKKFYIFSKPFYFPFKVADLVYMTSSEDRYCFINAPNKINEEISDLNQKNLLTENCSENDIEVCFSENDCDINVDYEAGYVEKEGKREYFTGVEDDSGALMYAAIFSDKEEYECQLKRLMLRLKEISLLYMNKELFTKKEGCGDNLGGDLNELSEIANSLKNSEELEIIKIKVDIINKKNNARICMLW